MANISRLLTCFHLVSGLKVNLQKSCFFGLNLPPESIAISTDILRCKNEQFPLSYLGLIVGANMNRIKNWAPVIITFESRLSQWKATTLSLAGRITLIRSVLDSLPSHFFSLYKAPVSVLSKLESIRRSFFWGGSSYVRKISLISWDQVISPVESGGLGLGSLQINNLSLLSKWWWRWHNDPSSLWARVICSLHSSNRNCSPVPLKSDLVGVWKAIANLNSHLTLFDVCLDRLLTGKVGDGANIRFWLDAWIDKTPLYLSYPDLFRLEKHKDCFIKDRCTGEGRFSQWEWCWSNPPSSPNELHQFQSLLSQIMHISLSNTLDSWIWECDASSSFTTKSMKNKLQLATFGPNRWTFPWNRLAPLKANVLGWRLELNRIPTKDQQALRQIPLATTTCLLCNIHEESAEHLFLHCSFTSSLWSHLLLWSRTPIAKPSSIRELFSFHNDPHIHPSKRPIINLIVIAFCWTIWKIRNDCTFSSKPPSL